MPDEIDVPLDEAQEKVNELHREHQGAPGKREAEASAEAKEWEQGWRRYVAVSTALLAVVAAIGALQSGLLVNEALLQKNEQIDKLTRASDLWNYYQAEGLKALIYQTAAQALPPGAPAARADLSEAAHYRDKQDGIRLQAERLVGESERADRDAGRFLERHHVFAFSVSLCQIAIALSAVAALTQRRRVWRLGLLAGACGAALLVYGFLR